MNGFSGNGAGPDPAGSPTTTGDQSATSDEAPGQNHADLEVEMGIRPFVVAVTAAASVATPLWGLATPASAFPASTAPAGPAPAQQPVTTLDAAHPATTGFTLERPGEAQVSLTAWAPGVSWGIAGHESAVLSALVDGLYTTDVVIPSDTPTPREFFLGAQGRGRHTLTLRLATDRSRGGQQAFVRDIRFSAVSQGDPSYAVAAHAPVLYGRTMQKWGGAFQNAFTDVPLIAWHEVTPQADGTSELRYTVVWSNEDGGAGRAPASLMARWGRTTDIEWIYHAGVFTLRLDSAGNVVPGSERFQAPNHGEAPFAGRHEADHPILQTCTDNNNVCDQLDADALAHPMRFTVGVLQALPAGNAREIMMDRNPWTYRVAAQEMAREGKTEAMGDPSTPDLSDARNYLYLVVRKTTLADQNSTPWIGAAVAVKLRNDPTVYRSDHNQPGWSVQRDDPAATTVELPPGTTADQIERIDVLRVAGNGDNGGSIRVESIQRAMFLDQNYLPLPYFINNHRTADVTLTPDAPSATVWTAPTATRG